MKSERFLERMGILKHKVTIEELEAGELKLRELTADYLTEKIDLNVYNVELDKLPKLDLRQFAQALHFRS